MSKQAEKKAVIKGTYGTMYYVTDMPKTIAFFKEKMGLKPLFEDPEWTEFSINGHSLCLHPIEDNEKSLPKSSLIIHVEGIAGLVADLKAKGVAGVSGPHEIHPGSYHAQFNDPDGNIVSLYEGPKAG